MFSFAKTVHIHLERDYHSVLRRTLVEPSVSNIPVTLNPRFDPRTFRQPQVSGSENPARILEKFAVQEGNRLQGIDLSGIDLSGLCLENTLIQDCCMDGAVLFGCCLSSVRIKDCDMEGALVSGTNPGQASIFNDCSFIGVQGRGCQFRGAEFHRTIMACCNFQDSIFERCRLVDTDIGPLEHQQSGGCLDGSRFLDVQMHSVVLEDVSMQNTLWQGTQVSWQPGAPRVPKQGCIMRRVDLRGAEFKDTRFYLGKNSSMLDLRGTNTAGLRILSANTSIPGDAIVVFDELTGPRNMLARVLFRWSLQWRCTADLLQPWNWRNQRRMRILQYTPAQSMVSRENWVLEEDMILDL